MKQAMGFVVLAVVAGLLIGITRALTSDTIEHNRIEREAAIIAELLGGTPDSGAGDRLCRTEVRGYAGLIELLVLPDTREHSRRTIEAVRVLKHRETPGIGDFIELDKSQWIQGFSGLRTREPASATAAEWLTKLDAVTGATITRKAVIEAVANACPFVPARGTDPLFGQPLNQSGNGDTR